MEKESLVLIKQLIVFMEKKLEELDKSMEEIDTERFEKIKQECYDINKQIEEAIQ